MRHKTTLTIFSLAVLAGVVGMSLRGIVQEGTSSTTDARADQSLNDRNLSELNDLLEEKITALQRSRRSYHQVLQRKEQDIRDARSRLETLKRDVREKKKTVTDKQQQLEERRETNRSLSRDVEKRKKQLSSLADLAATLAERLRNYVRGTVPYQRDQRLKRLKKEVLTVQDRPVDALNTLWNRARKELNRSRTAETYTEQVSLSGNRKKHANLVRVGHNILFYITDVGGEVGRAVPRSDGSWSWRKQTDPERIRTFKRALEIMRDRARPVRLPLPLDLTTPSNEK